MTRFDELPEQTRQLAGSLQAGLRQQETRLDRQTVAALREARAHALSAAHRPAIRPGWLYASGGLATAAAVALVLVLQPSGPVAGLSTENSVRAAGTEAIDVLTDDVDADFYEDLELYRWLDRGHDGAA
ncbi:MAG: hypothetical protein RLZZ200_780 [Pseudomonadota bacterium]|jgi:hypothetical protein